MAAKQKPSQTARPSNFKMVSDPALRLQFDNREFKALAVEGAIHTFAVPRSFSALQLASRSNYPREVAASGQEDDRRLGVAVSRIILRAGSNKREIPVDHPKLTQGFHACEREGTRLWRWSNGEAHIPVSLLDLWGQLPSLIEIHLERKLPVYRVEIEIDPLDFQDADDESQTTDDDTDMTTLAVPTDLSVPGSDTSPPHVEPEQAAGDDASPARPITPDIAPSSGPDNPPFQADLEPLAARDHAAPPATQEAAPSAQEVDAGSPAPDVIQASDRDKATSVEGEGIGSGEDAGSHATGTRDDAALQGIESAAAADDEPVPLAAPEPASAHRGPTEVEAANPPDEPGTRESPASAPEQIPMDTEIAIDASDNAAPERKPTRSRAGKAAAKADQSNRPASKRSRKSKL